MKKGGINGIELKDFTKPIRSIGIINNSFIFLKFGKSIALNEIKIQLYLAVNEYSSLIFNLERDLVFLKEITINPSIKPD